MKLQVAEEQASKLLLLLDDDDDDDDNAWAKCETNMPLAQPMRFYGGSQMYMY